MTDEQLKAVRDELAKSDDRGWCVSCQGRGYRNDHESGYMRTCDACSGRCHGPPIVALAARPLLAEYDRLVGLVGDRVLDSDLAQEAVRRERERVRALAEPALAFLNKLASWGDDGALEARESLKASFADS